MTEIKTIALVQARMKSERLPGKVMKEVLGKPLIGFLFERMAHSKVISKIVLATSDDASNQPLCDYITHLGFDTFRGSESDVLDRFYKAAQKYRADIIVRTTADSPLMDYKHVDAVVKYLIDNDFDYVSSGATPPVFPDGLDTEVFKMEALEKAFRMASLGSDREHVTAYIKREPGFRIGNFKADQDHSGDRFTVDNPEDFEVVKKVIEDLYAPGSYFDVSDILEYKARNPELFKLNRHIKRNEGYEISLKKDKRG